MCEKFFIFIFLNGFAQIKFKTKAIQDFTTTAAGHLSFKTGDELEVLSELGDNYLARLGANKGMVESRMTEKVFA